MQQHANHYEVLGVPLDADAGVIRAAYHAAALQSHPDKASPFKDRGICTASAFQQVQAAWEVGSLFCW